MALFWVQGVPTPAFLCVGTCCDSEPKVFLAVHESDWHRVFATHGGLGSDYG